MISLEKVYRTTELSDDIDRLRNANAVIIEDAVNGNSADIATNADNIALKVDQSDLDTTNTNIATNATNISLKANSSLIGASNGIASLGSDGKVPTAQLPDTGFLEVVEYANLASFPTTGVTDVLYVALDTNKQYRWSGSQYSEISSSLAIGEVTGTAYDGAKGKANADNIATLQTEKADKITLPTENNLVSQNTDGSIKDSLLSISLGTNLFNQDTRHVGYYVSQINGEISANSSYFASDYIKVEENEKYSVTYGNIHNLRIAFYDSNRDFLSGEYLPESPITAPSGACYTRFSQSAEYYDRIQFEKGEISTTWEKYTVGISKSDVLGYLGGDEITEQKVQLGSIPFLKVGKNLWSDDLAISDTILNEDGTLFSYSGYDTSDYITINESTNYSSIHEMRRICFYDKDKTFLSVFNFTQNVLSPVNSVYAKISFIQEFDNNQFEEGFTSSTYEEFGIELVNGTAERKVSAIVDNEINAFLPSEICVAVGRTIEIYDSQVVLTKNINNYSVVWDCNVGKNMKRKWTYTGISGDIGEYPLTCTIYKGLNIVFSVNTTIKVVASSVPSTTVLTIGDSLTNNKYWLYEVRTLSNNNIVFVGTRGEYERKHEGRSGFSAGDYLKATDYTYESEGIHAFWNATNERFDWDYYKTTESQNPDVVQIFLGTNGMALDPTENADNIKQIVDYIRQDDSTIPIFMVYTLFRGNQDGIGEQNDTDGYIAAYTQWKLEEDTKVFNLMVELNSILGSYTNLYFVPIASCHDSEYNFGNVSTPVNPRAVQVEYLPEQATHPQQQGYEQMADVMYSSFCCHLN